VVDFFVGFAVGVIGMSLVFAALVYLDVRENKKRGGK
jgi:hypothetical protein